jgi:receptor protein-tyrosine kinase
MILISSAGPGDGKSVTAVNVAGALSLKTEANVLLADTDFRRSTIHSQLGLPAAPGLADVLSGGATLEEALIRTKQFPNLYVISAGRHCANPSELLDSTQWSTICNQLRSRFRYVIADSPPVASVADYELLQATCDGVVLVVRPDHTKRQACMKAIEIIPKDKLIGVVMNCVSEWFLARDDYSYYDSKGRGAGARNEPGNLHS